MLYGTYEFIHANLCRQFLSNLSLERLLWCFPSLYFTARELPPVLPFAMSSLSREDAVSFADNCCHNFYMFHIILHYAVHLKSSISSSGRGVSK